jgi:hypothetical protein
MTSSAATSITSAAAEEHDRDRGIAQIELDAQRRQRATVSAEQQTVDREQRRHS